MSSRFPESLLAVAAVPFDKGYDVSIVDRRVVDDVPRALAAVIGPETVLVGMTAITGQQIRYALEPPSWSSASGRTCRCAGAACTPPCCRSRPREHPLVDYVIVGDGDLLFCEPFERLHDGTPLDGLRGLVHVDNGAMLSTAGTLEVEQRRNGEKYRRVGGTAEVIRDLDSLPELPYELLDLHRYNVFYSTAGCARPP